MNEPRVLITGAGRGIGRAIALEFGRLRARVVACARSAAQIEETASLVNAAGGEGFAAVLDVTDPRGAEACLERVRELTGGVLDVLVNDAGVFRVAPFEELSEASWRELLEVNLLGAVRMTRLALPLLRRSERAQIVNIASTAAKQGYPGSTGYCASKYALRGFGDALREELREEGIRISTIYPGATDTTIFDGVPGDWVRSTMNRPEDVAAVVIRAFRAAGEAADLDVPPPAG